MNSKRHWFLGLTIALLFTGGALNGCARAPVEAEPRKETHELYDGQAQVLYEAKEKAQTSAEAMEYAKQALRLGDTDRALYQFVRAYELDPTLHEALYNVGRIQAEKSNLNRAALAFNMALKIAPQHAESLIELGLVELRLRRYEQSGAHINQAVTNGNESWRAFNGLAVLADLKRDFQSADRYYLRALKLDPDSPLLWNNRGYSRYLAGDWITAQGYIEKALDYDSGYRKAWLNLGLIYARQGRYDQAMVAFERVMTSASAYERIGTLTLIEGKYDIAERFLTRAIDESPTYYPEAYEKLKRLEALRNEGPVRRDTGGMWDTIRSLGLYPARDLVLLR